MSVPVPMRSESKLEVSVRANDLTQYTLQITTNRKVFTPRYDVLTSRIVDCAIGIGQDIWEANDIKVESPADYAVRSALQARAVRQCDVLLYLITLAKRTFHLSGRRAKHWSGLVRTVKDMAAKWRRSDAKRFGHLDVGDGGCRACNVWLRSANRSNSYNAGIVNTDGNVNNNNAYNGNRCAPDCVSGTSGKAFTK